MNSANRTLAFVLAAACSVAVAAGAHRMYQPVVGAKKTDVGTEFYPDFKDPLSATYLGVAAYNAADSKVDKFIIEKRDGQWRIPSHHNYPADAKDRLATTAASLIGVTRGQLVVETADSHARLNLLDPLDDKLGGTEGRGSRITLKAGDSVLTDLIIGKKDEAAGADRYYVRRADEDRVYIAEIKPDLSTKFTDWIQPNVLDATAATFRQIILDRYSVDESKGAIVQGDRSVLSRDSSTDEWKLEELPKGDKLKTSVVNQITTALADMKIVGVRPKTPGIAAMIKGDPKARRTAIDMLDMQEKGYFDDGKGGIVSNEGDFLAGTSEGIIYVLRFGKVVFGDDVDIEFGSKKSLSEEEAKKALEAAKAKSGEEKKEEKPADEKKADGESKEPKKENRFLFVTVQLNEKILGEPPVEPVKPTPPPGYKPKEKPADAPSQPSIPGFNDPKTQTEAPKAAPPADKPAEEKKETTSTSTAGAAVSLAGPGADPQDEQKPAPAAEEVKPETPAAETKPAEEKPAEQTPAGEPKAAEEAKQAEAKPADPAAPAATDEKKTEAPKDPFAEYEAALAKYEQEMDEYKVKKGEFDEKLKKARDREKALNERFAAWYYVIPAEVFDTINVKPSELVEPETTPAGGDNAPAIPPGLGGRPGAAPRPMTEPAAETAPPATPAVDAPKADAPKEGAPKAETPKEEAPKEDAPKADPPNAEPAAPEAAPPAATDTSAPKPE
ncbi:hypothetical protein Pan44_36160 [Caulifigura coniformis]|uniref:DUF4340 domain-containing protein n=1 Tax=Caulifigura coniformis TaxID=2527983 RepID=A0A517SHH3_9PLAN|nr:DUF4340 domain-containing protein [Caulifigura coniformis]QDT55571.1 hypothetical protein Pan44_36160 [Caulifigura coniformis]